MNDSDTTYSQDKTDGHVIKEYLCHLCFQVYWHLSETASRRFSTLTAQELKCFWRILLTFPLHDQSFALVFESNVKSHTLWVRLYSAAGAIHHTSLGNTGCIYSTGLLSCLTSAASHWYTPEAFILFAHSWVLLILQQAYLIRPLHLGDDGIKNHNRLMIDLQTGTKMLILLCSYLSGCGQTKNLLLDGNLFHRHI